MGSFLDRIDPSEGANLAELGLAVQDAAQSALHALSGLDCAAPADPPMAILFAQALIDASNAADALRAAAFRLSMYLILRSIAIGQSLCEEAPMT